MDMKPTYEELEQKIKRLEQEKEKLKNADTELLTKAQVFEMSITANSISDPQGHLIYFNNAFVRKWGYDNKEEVAGKHIKDFFKFKNEAKEIIASINETGEWKGEYTALKKDGTTFVAYGMAKIIKDKSGKDLGCQFAVMDISDQKQAKEALRKSEENLFITLNSIGDAVIATDNEGHITLMNPVAEKLTGWSLSEAKGRPVHEVFNIINEQTCQKVENPVEKVMREGIIVGLANHTVLIAKNGSKLPVADSGAPIRNDQGNIVGVVLVFRDVSEKRKAESALKESEELHRSMVKSMKVGVYICSPDFRVEFMNSVMINMLGQNATGKVCHKAIHDLDEKCPWCVHDKIQQGESAETEILSPRDNRYYNISHSPIFHQDGSISKMTIYRDITDRKKAEEERIFLYTAIEQVAESVIITDRPGTIQYVNPAFNQLSGYTQEEIIGQNFRTLKSDKHEEGFYKKMWDIISKGNVWSGRIINKMKDGTFREFETTISPIRNSSGKIINFVSVNRDITHEAMLEAQLQHAQRMESIGTLAGGIAHDFNNILSSIIGFTELGLFESEKESKQFDYLTEVLKAGKRATDLVQRILTFSRQTEKERKPVQIAPIVKEALKLLRATLPSSIKIRRHIKTELDPVLADPTQIHQVIMNLCTNAAHAMDTTGGILEVSLAQKNLDSGFTAPYSNLSPGIYLVLTVSDTGCGMTSELLKSIFDPYFTTRQAGEGTGLGLAVTYGIVTNHGGAISVESEPGKGSTFSVYLPAVKSEIKADPDYNGDLPTGSERILFVDDEPAMVKLGKKRLEQLGYSVTTRTSSIEALELFKAKPHEFDLVITDMTMPNMTGDRLAEKLLAVRPDIPVILCTGYSNKISEEKAKSMGIRAFVMKPIIIREMARIVRKTLED